MDFGGQVDNLSPLLALVDGVPVRAIPHEHGVCAACGQPMRAKCGQIVVWHWAHVTRQECDAYRSEGLWHLGWKARLADAGAQVEVIRWKGDECHIADVVLPNGYVLELAGTYHPADAIQRRERFYGPRMGWLYDARSFVDRIEFTNNTVFRFKQPPQSMLQHRRPVFWDIGEGTIYAIERLWRFREDRTYGALGHEGPAEEFLEQIIGEI